MPDQVRARRLLATIAYATSAFVALSITLAFAAPESQNLFLILLRAPGILLRDSFHVASLYIPAMLFASGALISSERFHIAHIVTLVASTVPFLTAALVFRLATSSSLELSPLTRAVSGALGRTLGLTTTVLLLVIELAALYLLWLRLTRTSPFWQSTRARTTSRTQGDMSRGIARISGLLEAPVAAARTPVSLTDLPEPDDNEAPIVAHDATFDPQLEAETVTATEEHGPIDAAVAPLDDGFEESENDIGEDETTGHDASDTQDPGLASYENEAGDQIPLEYAVENDDDVDEPVPAELEVSFAGGRFSSEEDDGYYEDEPDLDPDLDEDDPEYDDADSSRRPVPKPRGKRYDVPITELLDHHAGQAYWHIDDKTREAAETLRITLDEFGIQAEVTGIRKGPVITMFEILPAPGVKLSKIVNLSDNIALRLAAASVRIVAPIPGKHAVGIEIPNAERAIVGFAELLQEESFQAPQAGIPIALGKDIPGDAQIVDLTRMPHVLIAGATGSGKSVCVNSMICSILYRRAPHEVKLILIDPKIVELKFYNDIPHLLTPVITDPKRAFQALQYCIYEMERRYSLLDALQVRDIQSYNRKISAKRLATEPIPYIVVVVDEFADLMATSGKELESTLARLAAMSRAVGIHLVLATQRPSTDVITGLIKANIPSRIAFMVASKVDSRIILDAMGADKLLGRGDMLFTSAWDPFPTRMQGAFLSDEEVERVVEYVKQLGEPEYIDDEIFVEDEDEDFAQGELEDPLMEKAIEIVQTAGKASASYLQRRLKVGYNRAARMVEEMERLGIVGPQQGSKPREVIAGA